MPRERPLILGIETSCDDTACSVIDGRGRVLSSVVSSQLAAHQPYGGVVPEIASREHLTNWPAVSRQTLEAAGVELTELDAIAATRGPGLVGCLLVGLSLGRAMAFGLAKPFHGVHHLEGHLYSPFLTKDDGEPAAPVPEHFHGLVVSGGHTSLLEVEAGKVRSLVETRDDAMGEVFDKVGKRFGLAYPQGPRVDRMAEAVDPPGSEAKPTYRFAVPRLKDETDLFFSYSGLKSQALREIEALERRQVLGEQRPDTEDDPWPAEAHHLLAGFRRAAVKQIIDRLERHHRRHPIACLAVSGGAAANRLLRRELERWAHEKDIELHLVPLRHSGDNAAMIAFAALVAERRGDRGDPRHAVVASRIPF